MKNVKKYIRAEDVKYSLANTPQITFEVTDACNLNCTYCAYGEFYSDYDDRENMMLSIDKAIHFLSYMNELWISSYNGSYFSNVYISFYGGEPLMNMSFVKEIVQYIKNMECSTRSFSFSMTTNGLLLGTYADYLVENNFYLLISLDGNKENTSYRLDKKGNPVFDIIVRNVDLLKNKYPEYFETHVNFNAVLHNRNTVESIYTYFKTKYNKMPRIGEISSVGISKDRRDEFVKTYQNSKESLNQSEHYSEIIKDMTFKLATYQSLATYIMRYSDFVYYDYNELLYGKSKLENSVPSGTCMPFSKKVFMTVNNKLFPCEKIGHQFALGKVSTDEVDIDFEYIADKYNVYYSKIDEQCESCHNRKACIQCIFNLHDIDNMETIICNGYMNKKDFEAFKNMQMAFLENNPETYCLLMENMISN